jgi:two-component system phosphate regulon sensor histidine kinase PhoR
MTVALEGGSRLVHLADRSEAIAAERTRVDFVANASQRMQQLIEDLMSPSRIEAERFAAPRDLVDLLALIEEVRGRNRPEGW